MLTVEHQSDWSRDDSALDEDVRAARHALEDLLAAAPEGVVVDSAVSARIDDYGVLFVEVPLMSGDAWSVQVGDGWDRLLWISGTGGVRDNAEWRWDADTSPGFMAAVLRGDAERRSDWWRRFRVLDEWRWRDGLGKEHILEDRLTRRWLLGRPGRRRSTAGFHRIDVRAKAE